MKKLLIVSLLTLPQFLSAVTLGQIDTFEDGSTAGWVVGLLGQTSPVPPENVPDGGPGGGDDGYLLLTSLGGPGAGSRLVVINPFAQWAGDYLNSGVGAIRMDVKNFGSSDLHLRLLFERSLGGPPTDVAASTSAIHVPVGTDWTSIAFPIGLSHMTALEGTVSAALSETTILRIYSGEDVDFPPAAIPAQVGIDNIQAVPEPSTLLLLGAGLGIAGVRRLRNTSR